jgi:O-antigen ligase
LSENSKSSESRLAKERIILLTHNVWLHASGEIGKVGFITYSLIVIFAVRKIWRMIQKTKKIDLEYCAVSAGHLASLIGVSVYGPSIVYKCIRLVGFLLG